jgi:uncharacterized membrane protein YhiD involved in acid resistance
MMVSEQIILSHATADAAGGMDPLRTVAGLVGGIGFLGAGAIVQGRGSVRGLTTAASIWMTAALGIAAGVEAYGACRNSHTKNCYSSRRTDSHSQFVALHCY